MFYSQCLRSSKGPLGAIWVAAYFFKKLKKAQGNVVSQEEITLKDSAWTNEGMWQYSLDKESTFFSSLAAKVADSGTDGSFNLNSVDRMVTPTLLAAEKEEAKAVLTLFLKKRGLSNCIAARIINKSDLFIDHLVSRLFSFHKSRYLVGRELTTLKIRDALTHLEALLEEHGNFMVDMAENFPNPAVKEKTILKVSRSKPTLDSKKLKAISRVSAKNSSGKLLPHVLYLIELGMDLEQIKGITQRFPSFASYSLEGKIKPVVEFLLDLGVPKSDIPTILNRSPRLCGRSLSENLIPTTAFLENLGVDKKQWAKVIHRFPACLTYSQQKVKATVEFLYEMGLSAQNIGKILTRRPNIIGYNIEDNLRPTAEYFLSVGVDVSNLLYRCPPTFGLSIEANLMPVTEFFLEREYSIGEIGTMITRYPALYTFSLSGNLIAKWEVFLTMDYPKLVKFPPYFGYSLEERIKPSYARVTECGVWSFITAKQLLSLSHSKFVIALEKKMTKMLSENGKRQ